MGIYNSIDSCNILCLPSSQTIISISDHIKIYPNPSEDIFYIEIDYHKEQDMELDVVNSLGKIVFSTKLVNNESYKINIDLNTFSKGVYFLNIKTDKDFYIKKLVLN